MDIGNIKAQDIISKFSIPPKPTVLIALQQQPVTSMGKRTVSGR